MSHVILLGDSIFDNANYVAGGPSVIDHLQKALPGSWQATLLAVDGACTPDVERQLRGIPDDASHLVLSIGGNDAMGLGTAFLGESVKVVHEALGVLADLRDAFRERYRQMLAGVLSLNLPTIACTVYDSIPQRVTRAELTGLALFNDVITREVFRAGQSLIDLRLVCSEASDYAEVSPIEPSVTGGAKVARAIVRAVSGHDGARIGVVG